MKVKELIESGAIDDPQYAAFFSSLLIFIRRHSEGGFGGKIFFQGGIGMVSVGVMDAGLVGAGLTGPGPFHCSPLQRISAAFGNRRLAARVSSRNRFEDGRTATSPQ